MIKNKVQKEVENCIKEGLINQAAVGGALVIQSWKESLKTFWEFL